MLKLKTNLQRLIQAYTQSLLLYRFAYQKGNFACEPYNYCEHTAEVIGPVAEIEKVITGRCGAEKAVAAGKVIINGLMDDVLSLAASKKAVAKKATAKKTTKTTKA